MTTTLPERIAALIETITFQRGVMQTIAAMPKAGLHTMPVQGNYMGQLEEATRRLEAHAKALPEADEYQGWTNRETWVVNLWLSNDAAHYEHCRKLAAAGKETFGAKWVIATGNSISDYADELIAAQDDILARKGGDRMATDLMNAALARCDWRAIAAAFGEE